jgi:hypothetical protein
MSSTTHSDEAPLPDAAGAFTLTLSAAATVLDVAPETLLLLARAHCVHALMLPAAWVTDRPPVRFAPGLLMAERNSGLMPGTRQRGNQVRIIADALLDYLAREPTASYEDAMEQGRPLLFRVRRDGHFVPAPHLRVEVLHALCNPHLDGGQGAGAAAPMIMRSMILNTLERWGCKEMRGMRGIDSGRQHWEPWWRIPPGIWSPGDGPMFLTDMPMLNSPQVSS